MAPQPAEAVALQEAQDQGGAVDGVPLAHMGAAHLPSGGGLAAGDLAPPPFPEAPDGFPHFFQQDQTAAGYASEGGSEEADPDAITGLFIPGTEGVEGGEGARRRGRAGRRRRGAQRGMPRGPDAGERQQRQNPTCGAWMQLGGLRQRQPGARTHPPRGPPAPLRPAPAPPRRDAAAADGGGCEQHGGAPGGGVDGGGGKRAAECHLRPGVPRGAPAACSWLQSWAAVLLLPPAACSLRQPCCAACLRPLALLQRLACKLLVGSRP